MKLGQTRGWAVLIIAVSLLALLPDCAQAKKKDEAAEQGETIPTAVVTGLAGESYIFYGTGGITVEQNPRPGMWHSNMRSYKIRIDGSNMGQGDAPQSGFAASNFAAASVASDFVAVPSTAYFVTTSAICTLPPASGTAGREIMVCNNSKDGIIKYRTASGETLSGMVSETFTNSSQYKIDRLISDGKNWFKE